MRCDLYWNQQADRINIRHRPSRILNSSPVKRRNTKHDKQILLQQRYSDWISNMIAVVTDLSGQLSTTLTAWDEFEKRCSKYLPDDIHSHSIGHTFSRIETLNTRLDILSKEISWDQSTVCFNI